MISLIMDVVADYGDLAPRKLFWRAVLLGGLIAFVVGIAGGELVCSFLGSVAVLISLATLYIPLEASRNERCLEEALQQLDVVVGDTHIIGAKAKAVIECLDGPLTAGPLKRVDLCRTSDGNWFEHKFAVIRGRLVEQAVRPMDAEQVKSWILTHQLGEYWVGGTLRRIELPLLTLDAEVNGARIIGAATDVLQSGVERDPSTPTQLRPWVIGKTQAGQWFLYQYLLDVDGSPSSPTVSLLTENEARARADEIMKARA